MIVSLRSFALQKTLVKVCLEVIAHTLTNDQLIVLRRQFSEFDIDNQGMLRRVDLEKTLQNYGEFASEDIDTIFKGIDVDHNDKFIRYHEFLAAALSLDDLNEANFKAAFLALAKHEEFISIDNIREILGADLNESELLKLLDEVGLSVNDSLTYEAFKSIIQDNCDNNKI
jgi:Ca2+-binding EF-hand superfamily protein